MSNRPGNHATKKRAPPTTPGASPPHQRRRNPRPESSEASANPIELPGPAWVELLRSPVSEALTRPTGDDLLSSPRRITGTVVYPAQALFNTLSASPNAFTSNEWTDTLEGLHSVLFRGLLIIDDVLRLTNPNVHSPKAAPPPPPPAPENPSKDVLAAISDLRSTLEARLSKLEDPPSPTPPASAPAPPAPTQQSRTYAKVADSTTPPRTSPRPNSKPNQATARPKGPSQQTPPRELIRYVVNYQGNTPACEHRLSPQTIRSLVRAAASRSTQAVPVHFLGSRWNRSGNLILTFSPSTSPQAVDSLLPDIRVALTLGSETTITQILPWSRLVVSSAPARPSPDAPVYSSDAILEDLMLSNPVFNDVTITRKPEWVRKPELVQSASSFSVSFLDPDGSVARQLLRCHIFLFGAPVAIKRRSNRPRPVSA